MASAAASSNYSASAGASSYAATSSLHDKGYPKFTEYRSRVMLGELPQDFLRIQLVQAQVYDQAPYGMRQPGYVGGPQHQQQMYQNPNFLGYFTLTIAEAKLVKSSGLLGLLKMDPYVSFRVGHVSYETPTASSGGKNPQWKASYRINLFKGMDKIHFEVYDQRNFTEDSFIGECEVAIPREVMEGETRQHWYPLMGRHGSAHENYGDILIIMSFMRSDQIHSDPHALHHHNDSPARPANPTPAASATAAASGNLASAAASSQPANASAAQSPPPHSPSAVPKPPPPPYSPEDVRTVQEMFPSVERALIVELLDQHGGNKDLVVNQLLQTMA